MKNRKGLSEIVSAVLVIAVVISGMGLYSAASQQRILGDMISVKESLQMSEDQVSELVEPLGLFRQGDLVRIFVFNYGLKDISVTEAFVNGSKNMRNNINSPVILDLDGVNSAGNGLTVDITTTEGQITASTLNINTPGSNYATGEKVTVNAGNADAVLEITDTIGGVPLTISLLDAGSGYSDGIGVPTTPLIIGTLPREKTMELVLDFTLDSDIPATVENVVIRTDSGKIIEFQDD